MQQLRVKLRAINGDLTGRCDIAQSKLQLKITITIKNLVTRTCVGVFVSKWLILSMNAVLLASVVLGRVQYTHF